MYKRQHLQHPNDSIDEKKRLLVGAAISTHPEDRDRVRALVEREVDVLVIDASDGHTDYQKDALGWIKSEFDVPVVGGNVVTAAGCEFLAAAGADAVKFQIFNRDQLLTRKNSYYDEFGEIELSPEAWGKILEKVSIEKIDLIVEPYDMDSFDTAEKTGIVDGYKIPTASIGETLSLIHI